MRHRVTGKRNTKKRLKRTGNLLRGKSTVKRCLLILDLKPLDHRSKESIL